MSERRTIRETLHYDSGYSNNCGLPRTLAELVKWANDVLAEVPPELREAVEFEITTERDYDGDIPLVDIHYYRPETDDEMGERLNEEARQRAIAAQQQERTELAQLAALKAKYEGK